MSVERMGPEKITREDLEIDVPGLEESTIIIQRHEEFNRDVTHPQAGSLTTAGETRTLERTGQTLEAMMIQLPPDQKDTLDVMVIASPTEYVRGKRSMETAQIVLDAVTEVFEDHDIPLSHILNGQPRLKTQGHPIPSNTIVEPKIFTQSPQFVQWVKENYSNGEINRDFWIAYEGDEGAVKAKREEMEAEGPNDMADRLERHLYALKRFSQKYHNNNPGRRLILWTVSHYDTISPYVKTRIGGGTDGYLGVDYGGGFGIHIKPIGETAAKIGGISYPVELVKAAKAETASSIE